MYRNFFKRLFDFLISLLALMVLSPVILVLSIILFFTNRGKVFFIQDRPGMNERIFKIVKFKTMTDATDNNGKLLPDSERITAVGEFIRKTSLDEIPQLFNVLIGDMSLIGPRPLLVQYLKYYNQEQRSRHSVRPGITGWAQVNGRNDIGWQKKFEYDKWYVNHLSPALDLKIIFMTLKKVVVSEGISHRGEATMAEFKGNH